MKPTDKQIAFAEAIAKEFGVDPPTDEDREGYSSWISGLVDEFHKRKYKQKRKRRGRHRKCGVNLQGGVASQILPPKRKVGSNRKGGVETQRRYM